MNGLGFTPDEVMQQISSIESLLTLLPDIPAIVRELAGRGVRFHAPFRSKRADPDPAKSRRLARVRYRIETTAGQLTERFAAKRLKTKDVWHLEGRLSRAVRLVLRHRDHVTAQPAQQSGSQAGPG